MDPYSFLHHCRARQGVLSATTTKYIDTIIIFTPANLLADMQHFNILGLPSNLFFDKQGNEIVSGRNQGELDGQGFIKHLEEEINDKL